MKDFFSKRWYVLPILIVVIANSSILAEVIYNRSGETESNIAMSEREWRLIRGGGAVDKDNAKMSLLLKWRVTTINKSKTNTVNNKNTNTRKKINLINNTIIASPKWLTKKKLRQLGFNVSEKTVTDDLPVFRKSESKDVYLVAEYNGKSYKSMLAKKSQQMERTIRQRVKNPTDKSLASKVKSAQIGYNSELQFNSRLFVVDAGLDRSELREKYADKSVYALMRGVISTNTRSSIQNGNYHVLAYISNINGSTLHVPYNYHSVFHSVTHISKGDVSNGRSPRYKVKIAYGKNLSPWLAHVTSIE